MTAARIEGVIVGHLPVLGAAWITQFARHRSREEGRPVGLARLTDGVLSLDVVSDVQTELDAPECSSLDEALAAAGRLVRTWVVRVNDEFEAELAQSTGLNALTLLTGADEAAMVASYRTFKRLWPRDDTHEAGPTLRVAIFGADPAKAVEAETRLRRAASTFLSRDLESAVVIQRIAACSVATLYRGKAVLAPGELVTRIAANSSTLAPPESQAAPKVDTEARPSRIVESKPVSTPTHAVNGELEISGQAHLHQMASLLPGLKALTIRSPYSPEVEFASDGGGNLHLLALHAPFEGRGDDAVKELLAAANWAALHESLLRAIIPSLTITEGTGPTLHVLSENPKGLRKLLDSGIRAHLLVRFGDQAICRELN
jgi:hypothetical protein